MNLALSDEQVFLREAARGALSRFKTLAAARSALDGEQGALPDMWPAACEAGWPGLLIDEAHGGAGLDAFDAMLVLGECGRVLAGIPLLGHLPASAILNDSANAASLLGPLASGERRAAYLPASPPTDVEDRWSVDPRHGAARAPALTATGAEGSAATVTGELAFVPDAPGADVLVGVALPAPTPEGSVGPPIGVAIEADAQGVSVEAITRYDATRSLGHVSLNDAQATVLDASAESLAAAWHLAQALIAAESLGSVETALDMSVQYAKERHTFGRAIGSYQAVKHSLTEVLRQLENGRSLLYYAGWARRGAPEEFPLAAAAARSVAGRALDHAARTMISVHGGIGATWEHDAPLYFRRAQLSRRLLGGTGAATDRVAGELIAQADAA
ncbi:MAG TPA: acyl-CoA dehydrogenase family protein [Solirubrobacteraceae bacterium]|jgi:alkylation response protein AidB-like acyl-CoA dehydrogenase|nr:acyl-CoA dehydrogenase family protein [Solirubrobacteraceae bacterium]